MSLEDTMREALERIAREVLAEHARPAPDPLEYLTPEQVAELLKFEVETVRAKMAAGKFPGTKIEGKWRVQRVQLERHLARIASGAGEDAPDPAEVAAALARDMRGSRKAG